MVGAFDARRALRSPMATLAAAAVRLSVWRWSLYLSTW
jgi:hypothetical protein